MRSYGLPFSCFLLVLVAVIALACGSPPAPRSIQSLSISPATANADQYPNGRVQFTAIGYYTKPPSPVKPQSATWGACYQSQQTTGVSVSKNGVAQCAAGSVGTYTVWAFVVQQPPPGYACPNVEDACGGGGCQVTGTAQLTCP